MVLGRLSDPGHPTVWMAGGQGLTALAVGAGGMLFGHFYSPLSSLFSFSLSRYRLKYSLIGPLNPKQPTILWQRFVIRFPKQVVFFPFLFF